MLFQSALRSVAGYLSTLWLWVRHKIDVSLHTGFPGVFWVRPNWDAADMPSQVGKVVVVTGGNSGTGYETALAFFNAGATVYMLCRNEQLARAAIDDIHKGGAHGFAGMEYGKRSRVRDGGDVVFAKCDLADLDSVERCAEEIRSKEKRIDVFFPNAGVMALPPGQYTAQGYSMQFGTNVLGHQRLISLLLPVLLSSSARLILLSSAGHTMAPAGGVDYASLTRAGTQLDRWAEYGMSKWGDVALAKWVDAHYGPAVVGDGEPAITAIAIHPGLVATNLFAHNRWAKLAQKKEFARFLKLFLVLPQHGAVNQIWAATLPAPDARALAGRYVVPYRRVGIERPDLNDRDKVERLWAWCEEQAARRE
ncbi:hypothetical protein Q5752_004309 [Cryptotrichosporon argae]